MDGVGELLDVVGVDDDGVAQARARRRRRAEDQRAAFVIARGDEFLGHEIHAVVKRSDQAQDAAR